MREGAKSSPCRLLPLRVCGGEVDRSVVMRSPCAGVFITAVPITKLVAWGEGEEEFTVPLFPPWPGWNDRDPRASLDSQPGIVV